jgi:inorganic pyrophosphatase
MIDFTHLYILTASFLGLLHAGLSILSLRTVPVGEKETKAGPSAMWNDSRYLLSLIEMKTEVRSRRNYLSGKDELYEAQVEPYYRTWAQVEASLNAISQAVAEGAQAFLMEELWILAVFCLLFAVVIAVLVEEQFGELWTVGAFLLGCTTSVLTSYVGMKVAVLANTRTAYSALHKEHGLCNAFRVAYKGGTVLGFILTSLGLLNLLALILTYQWLDNSPLMYERLAGYGLGGSTVALFGRVGGGIFTKAADVGADLAGKVEAGLDQDDSRNPAAIADNVGDNVGDIVGMGADLFGSLAESTCAALVLSSHSSDLMESSTSALFPLVVSASGIVVCLFTSFIATHLSKVNETDSIESTLKHQLVISSVVLTPVLYYLATHCLPKTFTLQGRSCTSIQAFMCLSCGLWAGLAIGFVTEYFTSDVYPPVRKLAAVCRTSASVNIINGLALGYLSCVLPTLCLGFTIYISFYLASMYGIALAAIGMLSNLAIALAIDGYGPISDNAGGMLEMIHLKKTIRQRTDALDAAGNTTAAIGKGFAIASAVLVSFSLFGAFVMRVKMDEVDILQPLQFVGLLFGAMLPYAFCALILKSVGKAANQMVQEVRRQFQEMQKDSRFEPEHAKCVQISTKAALVEMVLPGLIVLVTPVFTGWLFGPRAVTGLLAGILVSGLQLAISSSNSGGAWDHAKKYIENERIVPKRHPAFKTIKNAAVIGDAVGDPMKDASGPSLNILLKLSAMISFVFGGFFCSEWAGVLVLNNI